jgi:uncharacterized protein with NAD-binding domain and iron-sulfur cluster
VAKQKVVVLGGGCAAMAAAFALSDTQKLRDQYEITVYQPGWRLGGKGAAGRNAEKGDRIEEHGLHVWSGFYENAFWMMRKVYAELKRPSSQPLATAFTAFRPRHYAALSNFVNGDWIFWKGYLPHDTGLPGDFIDPGEYAARDQIRSPWAMICEVVVWTLRYIESTTNASSGRETERSGGPLWLLDALISPKKRPSGLWPLVKDLWEKAIVGVICLRLLLAFGLARRHHQKAEQAEAQTAPQKFSDSAYLRLADCMACLQWWFHRRLKQIAPANSDERSFYIQGDLFAAMMIGILRDGVIAEGFDVIDDKDLRVWLAGHGALNESLANPTVDSAYSYVFSFEGGDPARPRLAAGVAIRLLLRLLLCSRGAVFWEMQGGMGDTVFAPIYEVLKKRGVRFEFFHRVLELKSSDGKAVDEITVARQATLKPEYAEYPPLNIYGGLPGWPSAPKYDCLVEGAALAAKYAGRLCELESNYYDWPDVARINLRRGEHFDHVVLGISVEAVKFLTSDLAEKNARFREGVEIVKTVRTQSMQLWSRKSLYDLGWKLPPPIVCSYGAPLDTWADMSGLLERESWLAADSPQSLAYFCGVMKDDARGIPAPGAQPPDYLLKAYYQVKCNARAWLALYTGELWPAGTYKNTTDLDYQTLYRPAGGSDVDRFDWQWFSANVDLSARYVLALPGTTQRRLRADESGFTNLVLAGDWVRNGLNYGCVESAVLGGLQAARAISGYPAAQLFGETDGVEHTPFAGQRPQPAPPPQAGNASVDYARRGGMDVRPPPWRCDDVQLDAFYLPGELAALQALCNRTLGAPSRGYLEYRPLTRYVVLTFQRLHDLHSTAAGCAGLGAHTYCEAAFWVFVQRLDRNGNDMGAAALMIPYIFADDGVAVATGREIYGYPKEHATVRMPPRGAPADDYAVQGLAVAQQFAGAPALPAAQILRLRRTDPSLLSGLCHAAARFGDDLLEAARGGRLADTLLPPLAESLAVLLRQRIDLVYLRQMRALCGGDGCDLQMVTTAREDPLEIKALHALPGRYELTLPPLASHPIAADLGLTLGAGNTVEVTMAARIDLAFTLSAASSLWPPQGN